jgi:hypothetical protein
MERRKLVERRHPDSVDSQCGGDSAAGDTEAKNEDMRLCRHDVTSLIISDGHSRTGGSSTLVLR